MIKTKLLIDTALLRRLLETMKAEQLLEEVKVLILKWEDRTITVKEIRRLRVIWKELEEWSDKRPGR